MEAGEYIVFDWKAWHCDPYISGLSARARGVLVELAGMMLTTGEEPDSHDMDFISKMTSLGMEDLNLGMRELFCADLLELSEGGCITLGERVPFGIM